VYHLLNSKKRIFWNNKLSSEVWEVQRVYFGIEGENPMFDSFPVLSDIDSEFKNKLDIDLDFEKYDYFLEYN
jgi:hypothetical protein